MSYLLNDYKEEIDNVGSQAWNAWLGNEINNLTGDNTTLSTLGQLGLSAFNSTLSYFKNRASNKISDLNLAKMMLKQKEYQIDPNIANRAIAKDFQPKSLNGNPFKINVTESTYPKLDVFKNTYNQTIIPETEINPYAGSATNFVSDPMPQSSIPQVQSSISTDLSQLKLEPTPEIQNTPKTNNTASNIASGAAGIAGGAVGGYLGSYLSSKLLGKSKLGQFASGLIGQGAGYAAGNAAASLIGGGAEATTATTSTAATTAGSSATSSAANLANIGAAGIGVANLALDIFDPTKKANWESGTNIGLGLGAAAATLAVPAAGPFIAAGLLAFNGAGHLWGQKTEKFTADRDLLASTGNSYLGSVNNILKAQSLSNQKYSAWNSNGRHKADKAIYKGSQQQFDLDNIMTNIEDLRNIATSTTGLANQQYELESKGGYQDVYLGKEGTVLNKKSYLNEAPTIIEEAPTYLNEAPTIIEEFQEGGQLQSFKEGGSFNIIPEGALHARLHHMEDADNLTKKGIPVVDNNGEQQAEIERNEIIYRISVTKRLEELLKQYENDKYSQKEKDQFAIEAGKLLVQETLYNTVDNTGIIDQIS